MPCPLSSAEKNSGRAIRRLMFVSGVGRGNGIKSILHEDSLMQHKKEIMEYVLMSKLNLPKSYLSPSQLDMYNRCPHQYKLRYVDGIKTPPAVSLEDGTAHHKTIHVNNLHKIKTGKDKTVKFMVQRFQDIFDTAAKDIPKSEWRLSETTKDKVMKVGAEIQKKYMAVFAPRLTPKFAELEVTIDVDGVKVLGYLDVAGEFKTPNGTIIGVYDYKTSTKKKTQDELESSIALSHYGLQALQLFPRRKIGKNPPHVGYMILNKGGDHTPLFQSTALTSARLMWYRVQVASAAKAISAGSFPIRSATGWECSERFCGFWKRCRGRCK